MVKFGFMSNDSSLQSFKTTDDVIFQVEKLEAGKSINKINEAFEVSNVENGTYRLKDHFEIKVKDGKIANVREIFVDATLEDGTKLPSVTTVLGAQKKQGIMEWRKRVGEAEANRISKQATGRGTNVHTLCERYLNNEPLGDVMPDAVEMFRSLKPLLRILKIKRSPSSPYFPINVSRFSIAGVSKG